MSPLPKIVDADLSAFVDTPPPGERRSVIVEACGVPAPRPRRGDLVPPRGTIAESLPANAERSRFMDELALQLAELDLPSAPVRLDAAEAFVLDVTPDQLREIVGWSSVHTVRRNRTHHR